jgi:hypothetical protein
MGISLYAAITAFLPQAVRRRKISFEIPLIDHESELGASRNLIETTERTRISPLFAG